MFLQSTWCAATRGKSKDPAAPSLSSAHTRTLLRIFCLGLSHHLYLTVCVYFCVPFSVFMSKWNIHIHGKFNPRKLHEIIAVAKYLSSYSLGFLWLEMFATIVSLWLCDAMPLITVSLFFWFLEFNFLLVHVMVVVTRHDSCGHKREQRFLQGTCRHHLHCNNNQP